MTRVFLKYLVVGLAVPLSATAGVDICSDPGMQSRFAVEFVAFEESAIDEVTGTADLQYNNYDLLFKSASNKYLFGAGHRYANFDFTQVQPDTNGHLHTFFLPLHILSGNDERNFRFSVAAAMSASSNVIKDPSQYTTDAIQVLAAAIWGRQIDEDLGLRFGLCADHRFGEYELYPAVSVLWQLNPDWHLELGFPNSILSYRFSNSLTTEIAIAPDGNEWYVEDSSNTRNSDFIYEAYTVEWSLNWNLSDNFTLTAGVGQQFDNEYEFTLLDQSVVRFSGDSVTRISVAIEWRF